MAAASAEACIKETESDSNQGCGFSVEGDAHRVRRTETDLFLKPWDTKFKKRGIKNKEKKQMQNLVISINIKMMQINLKYIRNTMYSNIFFFVFVNCQ